MSAIFLPEDVRELLKGKTVIYIGDSVQRSMYKDLVLLFQEKRYLTDQELRAKGELCFLGDELMEGGRKGEMTNSTKYREVRKFLFDSQTKVLYFFITACFGEYIEMVLKKLMKPDIIFMNSCLWDVHRYGTKGYEGYGPNLRKLVRLLKDLHPSVLFAWTTTPPVDIKSKAGFLEDRKDLVKINEVLRCNDIARQIMSQERIPIADFADVFRHFTHHRANDGVHWNERAHRRMTNILLETVSRHFNRPVPRPVGDDFNRNIDFDDRPPFPHSYSQPAFHHNDSWGSVDEFNWYNDRFMNDSAQDDFALGLDRNYGYGNYSFFEMEDEMPPRFMPPGRRMLPPIRGPPPPPGYRFGTGDPGMMWEGRKRKAREDDMPDGYSKRPYIEDRRHAGSYDRKTPSPLVENKPKLDGSRKSLSPDLDEKPATSNSTLDVDVKTAETHDSVANKSVPTDLKEPKIEQKSAMESDTGVSKAVEDLENSELQTVSVGDEKSLQLDKERKAIAVPHNTTPEVPPKLEGVSDVDLNESTASTLDGPFEFIVDKTTKDLHNEVIIADEKPGTDGTPCSEPEKLTSVPVMNEEKSAEENIIHTSVKISPNEKSVFARLSSTTAMILQSIQKSAKSVSDVMHANARPLDAEVMKVGQDVKTGKAEDKNLQPDAPGIILDEKLSVDIAVTRSSVTATDTDISSSLAQTTETGRLGDNKREPSASISEDAAKAKAKTISYYDLEESFEDIVASLEKMEDEELVDVEEESLLLAEEPSGAPANGVTEVGQKLDEGRNGGQQENKESAGKRRSNNSVLSDNLKSFGGQMPTGGKDSTVCSARENEEANSRTVEIAMDLNSSKKVESNDRISVVGAQKIESLSEDVTNVSSIEPQKQVNTSMEKMIDSAASTGNLASNSNITSTKIDISVANPVTDRFQPQGSSEPLVITHTAAQKSNPVMIVSPSPSPAVVISTNPSGKSTGSVSTVKGPSVPLAINAVVVSCGAKSPIVHSVTKSTVSCNTSVSSTPVSNKTTFVTFSGKSVQPVQVGTNTSKPRIGAPLTQRSATVPIGTKTSTVLSSSVKSAASVSLRNKGIPIGTKTVTVPPGTKSTPIASHGVGGWVGNSKSDPIISPSSNAPTSLVPSSTLTSPIPVTSVDTKPKLPCVPNPPSLDMKSPFFKPKISAKSSELSGSPSKSSTVVRVSVPPTNTSPKKDSQKDQPEKLADGGEKSAKTKADGTPSKGKTKVKKKKKLGKKGSKKTAGKEVEGVAAELKGVKSGGVKKKTKKEGKIKKKKIKDKIKNKVSSENKNSAKSSETVAQIITTSSKDVTVSMPQTIMTIETKDRPKGRQQHADSFNRTKRFINQSGVSPSGNTLNTFVPQAPQTFQPPQQPQLQPLVNAQQYLPNPQTFTPINPQPQVALVQQFPYGQQVFTNQGNSPGYATGFNALGTNTVFGLSPSMSAGYQQVTYYGSQPTNRLNGTNLQGTATNPNQSKEYQHLAWL